MTNETKAPYSRSKLMVVGEGRAGKTCTIRSLLRQEFREQDSTLGFDVKRVDASDWVETQKRYLVEHLENATISGNSAK